jgi:membrane-associated phospholipid phosphatase
VHDRGGIGQVMRRPKSATVVAVALVVLALLTWAVVARSGPLPGDLWAVRNAQGLGQPVPALAELVRLTTSTEACLIASIPGIVWLRRHHPDSVLPVVVIGLIWMLGVQPVSKELVDRPRPSEQQVEVRADHSSQSYPAGHSLSTTATWGAASAYAWRTGRRWSAAAFGLPVVLTAISSSVQGVHWPSDAVAGTIIGGLAAWLIVGVASPSVQSS